MQDTKIYVENSLEIEKQRGTIQNLLINNSESTNYNQSLRMQLHKTTSTRVHQPPVASKVRTHT